MLTLSTRESIYHIIPTRGYLWVVVVPAQVLNLHLQDWRVAVERQVKYIGMPQLSDQTYREVNSEKTSSRMVDGVRLSWMPCSDNFSNAARPSWFRMYMSN